MDLETLYKQYGQLVMQFEYVQAQLLQVKKAILEQLQKQQMQLKEQDQK